MAANTAFDALLGRMIELIDGKLTAAQRQKLASAMPQIQWDFPDANTTLCLAATARAEPDHLRHARPAAKTRVREGLPLPVFGVPLARTATPPQRAV
ncbi:MAG: hypothetical protein O3A18_03100 [Planctomycetota bacterium]|jgi:hypothetical protein|nr:hypothetical protein [Planctomycetota bacterium]